MRSYGDGLQLRLDLSSNYKNRPVWHQRCFYNPVKSVSHIADRNQTNKIKKTKSC